MMAMRASMSEDTAKSYCEKVICGALKAEFHLEKPKAVNPEASITCVNIYELPDLSAYRLQRTPGELHQMVEEDRSQAFRAFLHEYAGEEAASISNSLIHKSDMGVSHHITYFAREHQCDLIVIGAKGHSRMERLVLGSVTENLLSDNEDFPILVVK